MDTPRDPLRVSDRHGRPINLCDHWLGIPAAFLVCGGPSYRQVDYHRLAERGIASLGVNNVSGDVPVRAFTCSDPSYKFHHGIWLDPNVLKIVPEPRKRDKLRAKLPDDTFRDMTVRPGDCPSTYFFHRPCEYEPETFFTSDGAAWGINDRGVRATGRPKILFTFFLGLRLLHYLGVRRIYLLGVDFHMDPSRKPNENYGFGELRDRGACSGNNWSYAKANEMLLELRPFIANAGVEIFNTNQESRCTAFDYVPFDEALEDCRGGVPKPGEWGDFEFWYEKDYFNNGLTAHRDGKPITDCPDYGGKKGPGRQTDWKRGWLAREAKHGGGCA